MIADVCFKSRSADIIPFNVIVSLASLRYMGYPGNFIGTPCKKTIFCWEYFVGGIPIELVSTRFPYLPRIFRVYVTCNISLRDADRPLTNWQQIIIRMTTKGCRLLRFLVSLVIALTDSDLASSHVWIIMKYLLKQSWNSPIFDS